MIFKSSSEEKMNRQLHSLSSQELTLNITLKDLNIEARKILRRKLLKDNVQTSREESQVYVSGPYFPCGKYNVKKRLRRNSRTSFIKNCPNDEGVSRTEKDPCMKIVIINGKSNQTEPFKEDEHRKVFESRESSEERQSVTITTEECFQEATNNTASLKEKRKSLSASSSSRRSSQVKVRGTGPLSERRRDSRMSNENKTSPNHSRSNSLTTGHFALKNILNPLLRESLKKILNPQSYEEQAIPNDRDNTSPLVANENRIIFKDDILLPKIKRRLVKYSSLDYEDQTPSMTNDNLRDKYKKSRRVRFNEQSPELSSTKCTGIKVIPSHPVRMLSDNSEYAVKGIIGQWLKRRSGSAVEGERQKASMEKQEAYREIQLLKVGMSMRMLAGIV